MSYPSFLVNLGPLTAVEAFLRLFSKYIYLVDKKQSTIISWLYMYIMLQLCGLLWVFITNTAVSLGLMIAKEVTTTTSPTSATSSSSDFFSFDMSRYRKREILATFYVFYSQFRVIMKYLNFCIAAVWQSLNDFPMCRKQLRQNTRNRELSILLALLVPIVLISLSLITSGSLCGESAYATHLIDYISSFDREEYLVYFCEISPFSFIASGYLIPRRILTLLVMLMFGQFTLIVLNIFPTGWQKTLKGRGVAKRWSLALDVLTFLLGVVTVVFLIDALYTLYVSVPLLQELATLTKNFNTNVSITEIFESVVLTATLSSNKKSTSTFDNLILEGQFILLGWLLWLSIISYTLCKHSPPTPQSLDTTLKTLFRHLKFSFIIFSSLIFTIECLHPNFGFITAQIDLILLSIALPSLHVTLSICVANVIRSSKHTLIIGLPVAMVVGGIAVFYSKVDGPGSFFMVSLHVFTKILDYFGRDMTIVNKEVTTSDAGEGPPLVVQGMGIRRVRSLGKLSDGSNESDSKGMRRVRSLSKISEGVEVKSSLGADDSVTDYEDETDLDTDMDDDDYDEGDESDSSVTSGRGRLSDPVNSFTSNIAAKGSPELKKHKSPYKLHKSQSLPIESQSQTPNAKTLKRASSSSSTKLTVKPRKIFGTLTRFGAGFAIIMSLAIGFIGVASYLQHGTEWYPDLIDMTVDKAGGTVSIAHAYLAHLVLKTKGERVVELPKYASCDQNWYGLSLLDYALLSEAAYFDPLNSNLDDVVNTLFDPFGNDAIAERLFQVRTPDPMMRKSGNVAQFIEAYSKSLNVSVIAIRGTDVGRVSDIVEDVKIFKEPVLLTMLSIFFPTIKIWPDHVSAYAIHALSQSLRMFGIEESTAYYKGILTYVRSIQDRQVVLTGHSLGGGLARIVAAVENLPTITFSPPGVAQSYYKFVYNEMSSSTTLKNVPKFLHHMSVAVLPEHDPVVTVDSQVGLIQRIGCDTSSQAIQNSCHMLEGTIRELLHRCGDNRPNRGFTDASYKFGLSDIVMRTWRVALQNKREVLAGSAMAVIALLIVFVPDWL